MSRSSADLSALIAESIARVKAMSPAERKAMFAAQARSWARGEAGFGSDADEAKFRAAYLSGDAKALAECKAEEEARLAAFDALHDI